MKFVEIYKLNNDGSQEIAVRCNLINDKVEIIGDLKFKDHLEKKGIFDYSRKYSRRLFPKDGVDFLIQLKYNFKSGYLNASDTIEK